MSKELFNAILSKDKNLADEIFRDVISQKVETALDIRKSNIASQIYNNDEIIPAEDIEIVKEETLEEGVSPEAFVKGGSDDIKQSEVDSLLGKIYDNTKLTKALIANKSYSEGESNPKKKNPHKKDTIDFHLFQLGQQVELSRS